jgi:hypothetical protein
MFKLCRLGFDLSRGYGNSEYKLRIRIREQVMRNYEESSKIR